MRITAFKQVTCVVYQEVLDSSQRQILCRRKVSIRLEALGTYPVGRIVITDSSRGVGR